MTDQFRFNLDAPLATNPKWIRNHRNKTMDIVVQDENNVLYLFSNTGDLFWKKQLSGPVIGEIEQVDLYKNRRLQKKINGKVFSLVQGGSGNNYFHFLFDILTKLKIYEERFSLSDIDYFYVPGINSWQKQILSLFKINEKKLIDSNKYRHIKAREIIAVDHPWYKSGYIQKEIKKLPEWSIFFLRNKFLDLRKKFQASKKIFIDRTDSLYKHCKLINNQEVIEYLEKKGFKSYQTSKLDFYEQIYLFENADIIISPHGAALTNIIFSKPGMKLFELIPKNHGSVKCERISSFLKFNYTRINLDPIINDNNEGDIKIELDQLEKIIQ